MTRDLDLDAIESRAGTADAVGDVPHRERQAAVRQLYTEDVPALLAEVRRLRTGLEQVQRFATAVMVDGAGPATGASDAAAATVARWVLDILATSMRTGRPAEDEMRAGRTP